MKKSLWLNIKNSDEWVNFLYLFHKSARDIYFSPNYIDLYSNDLSEAFVYIYQSSNKIFLYPFQKQKISLNLSYYDISTPYGYGGPLVNNNDQDFVNEAYYNFSNEAISQNIIAELIKFHPLLKNHEIFSNINSTLKVLNTRKIVYVNIDQNDNIRWEKEYSHANRKNINKSRRENIKISFSQDETTWENFEKLYSGTMKSNNASYFYYFNNLYYSKIRNNLKNNYLLVKASQNEKILSALLLLYTENYAHCHLIGSTTEALSLGVNNLLHHEIISWCKESNIKFLNIGGGRTNSLDDSLLKFKLNFSNLLGNFFIGERILNLEIYNELCDTWNRSSLKDETHSDKLLKYRYFKDAY